MNNKMHNYLWEQYSAAATYARKQGDFAKATRIVKDAFREAEEYGEIDPVLVNTAHNMAEFHLHQGRYEEAESLYRAVLEVREKLLGQTHDDVVDSLRKVAVVQIMAFRAEALGRHMIQSPLPWNDVIAVAS